MRYTSTRVMLVCCVLLLSCSQILAQEQSSGEIEYERGRSEASQDLRRGEYVIKSWGLARASIGTVPSVDDVYESMLWERYKIRHETIGGCLIDDDIVRYAAGYNEVSIAAIEAKYGRKYLEQSEKKLKPSMSSSMRNKTASSCVE